MGMESHLMKPGEPDDTPKKPLAIVLGITSDYAFAAAVVLMGLRRFPPAGAFEVVVFHPGIDAPTRALLDSILPCRFERYRFPGEIARRLPPVMLGHFSEMTYSRYECFDLLWAYSRVIWLDVDIMIHGDTSGLPGRCRGGIGMARERKPLGFNFTGPIDGFDMARDFHNSGVFVLSDELPGWREARGWLYSATATHAERLRMADQAVLNLWLVAHAIDPESILPEFNRFRHHPHGEEARIIHAVGHRKPWTDFADPAWNADYARWLAMGGEPCPWWKNVRLIMGRAPKAWSNPLNFLIRSAETARFLVRHAIIRIA